MNLLAKKIGIDLGTSTVLIYVKGEGIVVNEPSLVAVNRDGTRFLVSTPRPIQPPITILLNWPAATRP